MSDTIFCYIDVTRKSWTKFQPSKLICSKWFKWYSGAWNITHTSFINIQVNQVWSCSWSVISDCQCVTNVLKNRGNVCMRNPVGLYLRIDHRWEHRLPSRRGGHCFTTCRSSARYVRGSARHLRPLLAASSTPRIPTVSETNFCYYGWLLDTPRIPKNPALCNSDTTQLIIRINTSNGCHESQIYFK